MNDEDLIRRFAEQGNHDAFAQIVHRHFDWVLAMSVRLTRGNHALADDVSQAVFILLARKARTLRRGTVLTNWLFAATRFCYRDAVRHESRLRHREKRAAALRSEIVQPSPAAWETLSPILDELIQRLGKSDRLAVLLRYYQGKTFSEIGAAMRISEETARKRISRSVDELRRSFAKRGVTVDGTALGTILAAKVTHPAPAGAAAKAASIASTNISGTVFNSIARGAARKMLLARLIPVAAVFSTAAVVSTAWFAFHKPLRSAFGPATGGISQTTTAMTRATSFSGRVISPQGTPVAGARVTLIGRDVPGDPVGVRAYSQTVTDAQGNYTLKHFDTFVDVLIQADGYAMTGGRMADGAGNDIKLRQSMTLRLKLLGPGGTPASGVRTALQNIRDSRGKWDIPLTEDVKQSLAVTSDQEGICLLTGVPRDTIVIPDVLDDRLLIDQTNRPLEVATGPDATFDAGSIRLSIGAVVSGRVIDAQTQTPLAGARVRSDRSVSGATDAQGNYRLPQVVDSRSLRIDFVSNDPALRAYASVVPMQLPPVKPGGEIAGVDWQLVRGGTVRGKVTTEDSGRGLPNVRVQVKGLVTRTAWTAEDGTYELSVMPGAQTVSILRYPSSPEIHVMTRQDETVSADLEISEDRLPVIAPRNRSVNAVNSLRVRVRDELGAAVAHAKVMPGSKNTTRTNEMMLTGADGTCVFEVFDTDPNPSITVAADGYAITKVSQDAGPTGQSELVVTLRRSTRFDQIPPSNLPR